MQQLNWLRDNRGQIKAYMYNGEFKMVVAWYNATTMNYEEIVTETDDLEWWEKIIKLDPRAKKL